ncbi:MAG: hypothetical protein GY906_07655, partial [bacterium]|nr:hypothetical protein [bacterium]
QAEQPAAAAWCIRRVVWDALEGLHSGFAPAWWEDVDFCVRLAALEQAGGSVDGMWLVPQARVVHHGGSSLPHLSATEFVTMFSRNLMRFAERHYSNQIWWLRPCLTAALLAKAIARPSLMASYVAAARTVIRHTTNE